MTKGNAGNPEKLHNIEHTLKNRIDELAALYKVSRSITTATHLNKILNLIVKKVADCMHVDICIIHMIDGMSAQTKASCGLAHGHEGLFTPVPLSHGIVGRVVKTKRPVRINSLSGVTKDRLLALCKRHKVRSIMMAPLIERKSVVGLITICSKQGYCYTRSDEQELVLFASQALLAFEHVRLLEETKTSYLNTIKLLASVIDAKDTGTEDHSESVMRTALAIARAMKLSSPKCSVIKYASLLHDIGKIGIDINILRKPAPLTAREWVQMKTHPKVGASIVAKAGFLDDLIPAILYHHVKFSGGGYPPTQLKGAGIPIEARILSVADAYESMLSDRPYRKHLSRQEAIAEIKRCSGTQFDPAVVRALLRYLQR